MGGIHPEHVTEELLQAAFIPFGDIKNVSIPRDFLQKKTNDDSAQKKGSGTTTSTPAPAPVPAAGRGYGFVEFEEEADAAEAIDNMNGAEFFGKILNVYYARPMKQHATKAVWAEGGGGGGGGAAAGAGQGSFEAEFEGAEEGEGEAEGDGANSGLSGR